MFFVGHVVAVRYKRPRSPRRRQGARASRRRGLVDYLSPTIYERSRETGDRPVPRHLFVSPRCWSRDDLETASSRA